MVLADGVFQPCDYWQLEQVFPFLEIVASDAEQSATNLQSKASFHSHIYTSFQTTWYLGNYCFFFQYGLWNIKCLFWPRNRYPWWTDQAEKKKSRINPSKSVMVGSGRTIHQIEKFSSFQDIVLFENSYIYECEKKLSTARSLHFALRRLQQSPRREKLVLIINSRLWGIGCDQTSQNPFSRGQVINNSNPVKKKTPCRCSTSETTSFWWECETTSFWWEWDSPPLSTTPHLLPPPPPKTPHLPTSFVPRLVPGDVVQHKFHSIFSIPYVACILWTFMITHTSLVWGPFSDRFTNIKTRW